MIKIDIAPSSIEAHSHVTYGLVGDASDVVSSLITKIVSKNRAEWLQAVKQTKMAIWRKLDRERQPSGPDLTPQSLIAALETHIARDAIVVLDTGDHTIWFNRIFRAAQQMLTFSGKWRTMGFGLPAAISAKLQYPNKQVTALAGDGSFLMTAMELSTLVKYDAPVKIIVANNGTLAAEQSKMTAAGLKPFGVELTNPDFSMLADAFGIRSFKVQTAESLPDVLRQMYADDQAALLDAHITAPSPIA